MDGRRAGALSSRNITLQIRTVHNASMPERKFVVEGRPDMTVAQLEKAIRLQTQGKITPRYLVFKGATPIPPPRPSRPRKRAGR